MAYLEDGYSQIEIAVNRSSFIKQFSNTFSSFSFVYLDFFIFFKSYNAPLFQVFGIFAVSIGFGSAFFHATLSFLGQTFDIAGIYFLTSFMPFIVTINSRWENRLFY